MLPLKRGPKMAVKRRKRTTAGKRGLGRSASEHNERADYLERSAEDAVKRGLRALDDLNCKAAYEDLLSARGLRSAAQAETEAAGRTFDPASKRNGDYFRLAVDFGRQCVREKDVVRKQRGRGKN